MMEGCSGSLLILELRGRSIQEGVYYSYGNIFNIPIYRE